MHFISLGLRRGKEASVPPITSRFSVSFVHFLFNSRVVVHCIGKTRRFCLVHFRKEYVRQQLLLREGNCRQCGHCCNMLLTCPMLTNDRKCMVHGICRPLSCKIFPIDQRDIAEVGLCGGNCGFHFEKTDPDQTSQRNKLV